MEQFHVIVFLHYQWSEAGWGAVLHLFSIYIDEMLTRLCMSGFGCMLGHKYYGAVGYAVDIYLVTPSIYALNKMCDICLEFTN